MCNVPKRHSPSRVLRGADVVCHTDVMWHYLEWKVRPTYFVSSSLFFSFLYLSMWPKHPVRRTYSCSERKKKKKNKQKKWKEEKKGKVSFLSGSYLSVKIMSCHARVAYHISAMYDARGVVAIWDVDNTL